MLHFYKFDPILKQTLWGGHRIVAFKGIKHEVPLVGESWEISGVEGHESVVTSSADQGLSISALIHKYKADLVGKRIYAHFGDLFPLLVKFLDAQQDLSVQVHPNDLLAASRHQGLGKTEMWYVYRPMPDSFVYSGFSKELTPQMYQRHVAEHTLVNTLQKYDIKNGDVFYLPAGRVHSIGAGSFIIEIQQTSDITYRIYDFNRKDINGNLRPLHTDQAIEAIDFKVYEKETTNIEPVKDTSIELLTCPYFKVNLCDFAKPQQMDYTSLDAFVIYVCIEGACRVTHPDGFSTFLTEGETLLIPAQTPDVHIQPCAFDKETRSAQADIPGDVKLIETYIPS